MPPNEDALTVSAAARAFKRTLFSTSWTSQHYRDPFHMTYIMSGPAEEAASKTALAKVFGGYVPGAGLGQAYTDCVFAQSIEQCSLLGAHGRLRRQTMAVPQDRTLSGVRLILTTSSPLSRILSQQQHRPKLWTINHARRDALLAMCIHGTPSLPR